MKAVRIVGPSSRALAPFAAMLLVACATPLLAVEDVMMFEDGRTRFVAFVQQERVPLLAFRNDPSASAANFEVTVQRAGTRSCSRKTPALVMS